MSSIKIRTRYEKRSPLGLRFSGVSRVKQEFAEEANINTLVSRYHKTGSFSVGRMSSAKPFYGDFTSATDYQAACDAIVRVEDQFDALPAKLRWKFENDPSLLLAYLENPENLAEAQEFGLVSKPSQQAPIEVRLAHSPLDVNVPGDTKGSPKGGAGIPPAGAGGTPEGAKGD